MTGATRTDCMQQQMLGDVGNRHFSKTVDTSAQVGNPAVNGQFTGSGLNGSSAAPVNTSISRTHAAGTANSNNDDLNDEIGDTANEAGDTVSHTANEAGDTIGHTANEAGDTISHTANEAGDAISHTANEAGDAISGAFN